MKVLCVCIVLSLFISGAGFSSFAQNVPQVDSVTNQSLVIPVITSKSQWKEVIITDNFDDVKNLVKVKELEVNTGTGMAMYAAAKKAAIKKIKKEAAKLGCGIVYMPESPRFNFSVKGYGTAYKLPEK